STWPVVHLLLPLAPAAMLGSAHGRHQIASTAVRLRLATHTLANQYATCRRCRRPGASSGHRTIAATRGRWRRPGWRTRRHAARRDRPGNHY
ncbi:hypothetical protein ACFQX7_38190, partial [Luedemannella flava]